jgi:hypothetical protein
MKRQVKHTSQQDQEQLSQMQAEQTAAREFATVDEALREDRANVTVPPAVEQRLSKSIENLPKPSKPWWKRLMGS